MNERCRNPSLERCSPEAGPVSCLLLLSEQRTRLSTIGKPSSFLLEDQWLSDWKGKKSTDHLFIQGHLYMSLLPQQSPGASNNTMTIALKFTDEWPQSKWPRCTLPRKKNEDLGLSSASGWPGCVVWKTGGGVGGWAGTPSHMRPQRRASQSGRQEVAVVSCGTSSLQHLTVFTERGCSSRKGLTTEPQRLVFSAPVTRNIMPRGPWRTESFSKNAWWASHLSKTLLSVLFLLKHNQIHGTVRIKP